VPTSHGSLQHVSRASEHEAKLRIAAASTALRHSLTDKITLPEAIDMAERLLTAAREYLA
jgi:hypothetical protein